MIDSEIGLRHLALLLCCRNQNHFYNEATIGTQTKATMSIYLRRKHLLMIKYYPKEITKCFYGLWCI